MQPSPGNRLPPAQLQELDQLLKQFEQAWQDGTPPRIEELPRPDYWLRSPAVAGRTDPHRPGLPLAEQPPGYGRWSPPGRLPSPLPRVGPSGASLAGTDW